MGLVSRIAWDSRVPSRPGWADSQGFRAEWLGKGGLAPEAGLPAWIRRLSEPGRAPGWGMQGRQPSGRPALRLSTLDDAGPCELGGILRPWQRPARAVPRRPSPGPPTSPSGLAPPATGRPRLPRP